MRGFFYVCSLWFWLIVSACGFCLTLPTLPQHAEKKQKKARIVAGKNISYDIHCCTPSGVSTQPV
jgi:hypothetical protein